LVQDPSLIIVDHHKINYSTPSINIRFEKE